MKIKMLKVKITYIDDSHRIYEFSTQKAADDFIAREGDGIKKVQWL